MNRKVGGNMSNAAVRDQQLIWKILLTLGLALVCARTHAANICVLAGDYLGLQAALDTAGQNAEDDFVMLQSGQYDLPSNYHVLIHPNDAHDLTIEGGYAEFESDPCGGITSHDARQTVISGGEQIDVRVPDVSGSIALSTLMLTGVFNPGSFEEAISIRGYQGSTGGVRISNAIFAGNASFGFSAIVIDVKNSVLIENSLFYENATWAGMPTIRIAVDRPDDGFCVGIVHSTFTQNTSATSNVYIYSDTCRTILVNDVFWGNPGGDLELNGAIASVANVDVGNLSDLGNATTSQVLSEDPLFNPDFSLSDFSPLRDAGLLGGFIFANGEYDAFGNARIDGANPDIGAFEISDVIFAHAFDW